MATRKSGPLDAMVGTRVRMLRVNRGISQAALAERIGVNFQQVQKYEQGANRVGASRLAQIASALDVSVGAFFESSRVWTTRLEFAGSLACRAGLLARLQVLRANARSARPLMHREAG